MKRSILLVIGLCLGVSLCTGMAGAKILKPRILFVVDTSGSMNKYLFDGRWLLGDGSELYKGNDTLTGCDGYDNNLHVDDNYNCSRMFQAKEALKEVIFSTSEAQCIER